MLTKEIQEIYDNLENYFLTSDNSSLYIDIEFMRYFIKVLMVENKITQSSFSDYCFEITEWENNTPIIRMWYKNSNDNFIEVEVPDEAFMFKH